MVAPRARRRLRLGRRDLLKPEGLNGSQGILRRVRDDDVLSHLEGLPLVRLRVVTMKKLPLFVIVVY